MRKLFLLLGLLSGSALAAEPDFHSARSGGDTTIGISSRSAFEMAAPNLNEEELDSFQYGNRLFNTNWVIAPASVKSFDGLGPLFNRVSCSGCHFKDGRGRPPLPGETMDSMLLRLSVAGTDPHGGPKPHPVYGEQLQERAIPGVPVEGLTQITYTELPGKYPDGSAYSLQQPAYTITKLGYGPLGEIMISPRVSPPVFGLGLLEAIPLKTLQALEDPEDKNGDGISGRLNRVWNPQTKRMEAGRFGWKANKPTLRAQEAGAAAGDIGITSIVAPETDCTAAQKDCLNAPDGGKPELRTSDLDKLEFYLRTLAVPARRNMDDPQTIQGELLFHQLACVSCHTPTLQTGPHKVKAIANQRIHPYTDLLLHDMGEALADHRPDFAATGSEWRTPPLWGIGLVPVVNKHSRYLHDGRARNLEEAILWHGGEAEQAKENFTKLNKAQREAVLKFLESL